MTATAPLRDGNPLARIGALALRHPGLAILLASATILGSALTSQFVFGLQPCALCIYQRWPYVATMLLGAAAFALRRHPGAVRGLLLLAALAFLTDTGIAAFHVGVEQGWWQGSSECTGSGLNAAKTVDELRALLEKAPVVRCDEVSWSLFGISLAGFNFLASLTLAGFSLIAARRAGAGR